MRDTELGIVTVPTIAVHVLKALFPIVFRVLPAANTRLVILVTVKAP